MDIVNEIGNRYGRLTVVSRGHNPEGQLKRAYWNCKCDCGKELNVLGNNLRTGNTKSCGCLIGETSARNGHANAHELGSASLKSLFGKYKSSARRRKLGFELSLGEFKTMTSSLCYYCGAPPSKTLEPGKYNGDYVYNGIDRVDNREGYIPSNCVPCCTECNSKKKSVTPEIIARAYSFLLREGL